MRSQLVGQPSPVPRPSRPQGTRARVLVSRWLLGLGLVSFAMMQAGYWLHFSLYMWGLVFCVFASILSSVPLAFGVVLGLVFEWFATDEFWLDRRSKIEIAVESGITIAVGVGAVFLANYQMADWWG